MIRKVRGKIKETIEQYHLIQPGDVIVLGLSGGPDSLCLFHVLLDLSNEMGFTLEAAHVNHKFRPGAAEDDQQFVENLCNDLGIKCWIREADCTALAKELKITSEEAGRKVRYDFFAEIAAKIAAEHKNCKVAIAHNRDDQAETILFRILRGTGTDGLAGIDYSNINERGTEIIRPLLDVPRTEIEDYCKEAQLAARIDQTNLVPIYGRNKIRLNVIPYLEEMSNTNLKEALIRMGDIAREDRNYLWQLALIAYRQAYVRTVEGPQGPEQVWLDQNKLMELAPAVAKRVILHGFQQVGLATDISYVHLKEAAALIGQTNRPHQMDFPKGYVLRVSYGTVGFCKAIEKKECEPPDINVEVLNKTDYVPKAMKAAFDFDRLKEQLGARSLEANVCIRRRQPGDYLSLGEGKGRKKIHDLFIDMKVPKELRDQIYLVAIGHEVLWIPKGNSQYEFRGRYSGSFKVSEETKKVITVEINGTLW